MQLAQISGASQSGDIASAEIEHPLRCGDRGFIIPQFDVGIYQVAVNDDIIGRFLVESGRGFERLREFVPAELQPGLRLESLIVVGRELEGTLQRLFGFRVVAHVGSFAGTPGIRHGERVVVRGVIRMFGNLGLSLFNRRFGGRGCERYGGESIERLVVFMGFSCGNCEGQDSLRPCPNCY